MRSPIRWYFAAFLLLLVAGSARADDVDVELVAKVLHGARQPAVVLKVNKAIASVRLDLRGDGGQTVGIERGSIARGTVERLELDAPIGSTTYEGTLAIRFADGEGGEMPLKFSVEVVGGLEIEAPAGRLNLKASQLEVRISRPAQRCDYRLFLRGGRPQRGSTTFDAPAAWSWLTVRWKKPAKKILKIRVDCFDVDGFSRGLELTPTTPPELSLADGSLDAAEGKLEVELSRQPTGCDYELTYDGALPVRGRATWKNAAANTRLPIHWQTPAGDAVLLRIAVTCQDANDSSATLEIFPWELDVPHEEVHFDSGKWQILPGEAPKLDAALEPMRTAIRRYRKVIAVKLFVIGYTDTVGARDANRTLSVNRARAIAEAFRARGIDVPIRYAGFGEEVLAVPTADETDELKNRRARYILAVEPPERAGWNRLE